MLTGQQLKELEPLTKHPKYGKLLLDSIQIWKQDDFEPRRGYWGITINWERHRFVKNHSCFCLLGASLVYKDFIEGEDFFDTISRLYNIPLDEVQDLMIGFDELKISKLTDARNFGSQISNILCGELC